MRSVVPFVFWRRQNTAFDVVVDHGRGQQSFAVDIKRAEIFFRKTDHLIHIKIKFRQLVPSRNVNFRYGGDGSEKKLFVHKFLHAGCSPAYLHTPFIHRIVVKICHVVYKNVFCGSQL